MTHERGRFGIGVQQGPGQGGDDYPIVGPPSADIDQLLADAYLAYIDNINTFVLPFKINYLHGFGTDVVAVPITPVNTHDVEIVDANDVVVFNSLLSTDFKEKTWDTRLKILEWTDAAGQILRIVYHIEWSPEDESRTYDIYIEPTDAVLDARAVWQMPKRLDSIRVGFITLEPDASGDLSNITLQNGFNTTWVVDEPSDVPIGVEPETVDGSRRTIDITLAALPGSGDGRFGPGCGDAFSAVRRINTVAGDDRGNFLIDATGCYRVERPIQEVLQTSPRQVQVRDHTIRISNDCGPCCDCDDFIAVWESIRKQRDKYADLIARAQVTRDTYHDNRTRFNTSAECRDNDRLRLILQPACPNELGVAAGFCNNSEFCVEGLVIHISFSYKDGTGLCDNSADTGTVGALTSAEFQELTCSTVFRQGNIDPTVNPPKATSNEFYTLGGEWPHFYAIWNKVDPGAMASVTFRLKFSDSTGSDVVEAIADAFVVGPNIAINTFSSPVPGYLTGSGPISTPAAMKLVDCPVFKGATLIPECCPEESLSVDSTTGLFVDLISSWKLDELGYPSAGTRFDSHGSNDLTEIGDIIGDSNGKIDSAAFPLRVTDEYLTVASNSTLQLFNQDFTINGWFLQDLNLSLDHIIASHWDSRDLSNSAWAVKIVNQPGEGAPAAALLQFAINGAGGQTERISPTNVMDGWHYFIYWYDHAGQATYWQVDNGVIRSYPHTGGILASTADFRLGKENNPAVPHFERALDQFSFWKRVLTFEERELLWNDGAGLSYDDYV